MSKLSEEYALGLVFASTPSEDYATVIEMLNSGEFPDEVSVWQPFESYQPSDIAETIEDFEAVLSSFEKEVLESVKA